MRALLLALAGTLAAQTLPTGPGPYFVATGDINGDGHPDVALPNRGELLAPTVPRPANDTLTVYLTDARGRLAVRRDYTAGFGPYTAAIADLDGDRRNDVAVVNFQANDGRDLSLLWGRAGEDPLEPAVHLGVAGAAFPYDASRTAEGAPVYPTPGLTSLAVLDANRDGRPDIVAVAWSSDFFVLFENLGQRRFRQKRWDLPPGPRDAAVADFDGDRIADLAFTIYSSNLIEVWRGDGKGGFARRQTFHAQGMIPYHLKAGDLDRDGWVDLVVGNRGPSDNVAIFRNEGGRFRHTGSLRTDTSKRGETTADEIRDVLLYDADGDGLPDLAAACHLSHKVVRWKGTGKTGFGQAFENRRVLAFPGKGPRSLAPWGKGLAVAMFDSNELVTVE